MIEQNELRQLEDRCIQDCAPACTSACPIHVDVRTVLAEMGRGDFPAALKVLKKTLPFPGITGRICPHPCQAVCKRSEAGEVIEIAALERACAEWGGPAEKPRVLPKRGKRAAIVGGGLSGLTAAYDLARKGYAVVIYEASERLGGRVWNFSEQDLPRPVIQSELAVVEQLGAQVRLNTPIQADGLADLRREFDGVYLAAGVSSETFGLAVDERGRIHVDATTMATSQDGVFAGGGLLQDASAASPIQSISDGRRAANSMDRYLQKVSLTAARANEGAYITRLYTNTQGIAPLPATPKVDPAQGYTCEEAAQEARRCLQCECMECVKVCEYLRHYGRYPRQYVREIYNNLSIIMGERKSNRFVNSCSLCGLCGQVCPKGLDMGDVVKSARQVMVGQNRMPPSAHDFALRDMQFSNGEAFSLARHRPGAATSDYVFFPGCQLAGSSPQYVEKVYGYLQGKLGHVGLMLRCCGAPADWAGRQDMFEAALSDLHRQYGQLGAPQVVLACSSCYQVFKRHLPEIKAVSLWELLDRLGLPDDIPAARQATVSVHDPCTTRYESTIQDSARNLVRRLGYEIEELPLSREKTECCSYGGVMWLANRDLAEAVVQRRITASAADYVTYCAVCRDFFAARGKRTLHLLDLIYSQDCLDERATRAGPGYSQRRENRAQLKCDLLKKLWGEDRMGQSTHEAIQLIIAADVQARLEQRLILVEDIQRVIEFAERSGGRLLNRQTGHVLAHYRPTTVTYWVEYTPQGDAFIIHNAYSHRMEIVEEGKA